MPGTSPKKNEYSARLSGTFGDNAETFVKREEQFTMQQKELTGYPSIDKPWLKYYSEEAINTVLPEGTIYQYIRNKNIGHESSIAIQYFGRRICFSRLFQMIDQCAESLFALGVRKGDIVTIQALSMPQVVTLIYAISKIGAVANLIFVTACQDEVCAILCETSSKVFITIDNIYMKLKDVLPTDLIQCCILLSVGDEADLITKTIIRAKTPTISKSEKICTWKEFMALSGRSFEEASESDLPVVMVYTGGTTGKSKAVVLTNRNINSVTFQYENANMGFERGKKFLNMLPPFVAFGITVSMHLPLSMGITDIIMVDPSPDKAGENFAKYRPNYYVASAVQVERIISYPKLQKADMSFVSILAAGGDAVPASVENQTNAFLSERGCNRKMIVGYGMTEVGATVCTALPSANKVGTVGVPLPKTVMKVIDPDTLEELPYGKQGELCISAPSMMQEYYQHPGETAEMIRLHADGIRWVHSGDIATIDADGFVSIVGRIKRMILVERDQIFHKVFPKSIEDVILQHVPLKSFAVVGRHSQKTNDLIAFFVLAIGESESETIELLQAAAQKNLAPFEQPDEYIMISEMPHTLLGKIDFRKLEQMALE